MKPVSILVRQLDRIREGGGIEHPVQAWGEMFDVGGNLVRRVRESGVLKNL